MLKEYSLIFFFCCYYRCGFILVCFVFVFFFIVVALPFCRLLLNYQLSLIMHSSVNLDVLSLNVRGIRDLTKRRSIFLFLKDLKANIYFLQET